MTSTDPLYLSSTNTLCTKQVIGSANRIDVYPTQFNIAKCIKTKSFYVVYKSDYNSILDDPSEYEFIPEVFTSGSSAEIKTNFYIGSARGYKLEDPGLLLTSFHYYRGTAKLYTENNPNTEAANSFIITGGSWELYTGKNYSGCKVIVTAGEKCPYVSHDNAIKSVRLKCKESL